MVVRMRQTRSKTRARRAGKGLKTPRLSLCVQCGVKHIRHRACDNCGTYRGTQVIDVEKRSLKQQKKKEMKKAEG